MKERINAFISAFSCLLLVYFFWLTIFLIARVVFIFSFGRDSGYSGQIMELFSAFIMGFRTDTMSISYFLFLPFLFSFGFFAIKAENISAFRKLFNRFFISYGVIMTLIIVFGVIADNFYYTFFADHFNILIFDLFKDDTSSVFKSMWTDYPLIKIVFFLILAFFISRLIIERIIRTEISIVKDRGKFRTAMKSILIILTSIILFFTGLRNSWGTFPLRMENTGVSGDLFINKIGLNSFFCLQNAYAQFQEQDINTDIEESIRNSGFSNIKEINDIFPGSERLIEETPCNDFLEENPPNVVFVQMESMSQYLMEYHSQTMNLLGDLEDVLPGCYVFRNFVSSGNTTINTLEEILLSSPFHPVSQSVYRENGLSGSVALQFKNKGYQTCFFTGARLAWRNLENYLYKQCFDIVEGDKAIQKSVSSSSQGEWGLFDEFVYDRAHAQLSENPGLPKFIYIMTTTNHTPYDVPLSYRPYSLKMEESFSEQLIIDPPLAEKQLIAFQYANDYLGKFVKRIRSSGIGEKTIIVITGDHARPNLFNFSNEDFYKKYTVPLIVYVPQKYRPRYKVDTSRFGSHKDIFPGIFRLALSGAPYLNCGNNLFSPESDTTFFYGQNNNNFGFSRFGAVYVKENQYYMWSDSSYTRLELLKNNISKELDHLNKKVRAQTAAMKIFIQTDLKNKHE